MISKIEMRFYDGGVALVVYQQSRYGKIGRKGFYGGEWYKMCEKCSIERYRLRILSTSRIRQRLTTKNLHAGILPEQVRAASRDVT
jgi:hypothetical protein